jgi:SAM-dependent methyltransferase
MGYRATIGRLPLFVRLRKRRYGLFEQLVRLRSGDRIVDVGCGSGGALERFNDRDVIVGVDPFDMADSLARFPNVSFVQADGCAMPFRDAEFDVAFSNSVIEHVAVADRERFASEVGRVAARYFVQTPNKWFPIEPHYMLPLIQFLPWSIRKRLNDRFRGGAERIELLTAPELRALFPDGTLHREKILGLTKSLIVVRG